MFPSHSNVPSPLLPNGEHVPSECVVVREILDRVGDKWSVLVIALLGERGQRFSELRRSIDGISQRMLTLTLKRLETDGIVTRTLFPSVPPRVDYELTELGQTLRGALVPLQRWASTNKEAIARNRMNATR